LETFNFLGGKACADIHVQIPLEGEYFRHGTMILQLVKLLPITAWDGGIGGSISGRGGRAWWTTRPAAGSALHAGAVHRPPAAGHVGHEGDLLRTAVPGVVNRSTVSGFPEAMDRHGIRPQQRAGDRYIV
jgi:hypothetical protein